MPPSFDIMFLPNQSSRLSGQCENEEYQDVYCKGTSGSSDRWLTIQSSRGGPLVGNSALDPGGSPLDRYRRQFHHRTPVPMTRTENDSWASTDPTSSLFNWKFPDPPHTGVCLSETMNNGTEPVTFVLATLKMDRGSFWVTA